ncbi:MAG: ABC transporter permease [Woeseiaceae bacterium]|nr:ABC transporter permease [Woeseiaceae bacterium]
MNNLKIAIRNIKKNKLFATINIAGLAIGLTVYLFGGLLVKYEETHDLFFENASNTYTVGSIAAEGTNFGVEFIDATYLGIGPLVESELSDVLEVARTYRWEYLVSVGEDSFYQNVRFTDPALLRIFDFDYLHGDETALEDASGLVITESTAIKYFGDTDVVGETMTFDNAIEFRVAAVIEDVALNSHFNSQYVIENPLQMLVPLQALRRMRGDAYNEWNDLSLGNLTYVLLPENLDGEWLQTQVDGIYDRHVSDESKEIIGALAVSPLRHANLAIWDSFGMPVVKVIGLLSVLVLIVACVNYTNLATAQSFGRTREVGMRKTMGASKGQLLMQFLIESVVIVAIAMVVAIASIEVLVPLFNNVANKAMTLDYLETLPWLLATTLAVGLAAGAYPAWLITKTTPIDALRDVARKGRKGTIVRSLMIGVQFAISAFMLALVTIVYSQNQHVQESGNIYPRSEVYTLDRIGIDGLESRLDTLRHELQVLPDVESVAYSSQVPFEQSNSTFDVAATPGDEAGKITINRIFVTPEFFEVYDIPLIAGRNLSRSIGNDALKDNDDAALNIIVNELLLESLGLGSPQEAINSRVFSIGEDNTFREAVVVGVVPTQNVLGLFNSLKPFVFVYGPNNVRIASVRVTGDVFSAVEQIEQTWKSVIPDFPIQGRFLDDVFNDVYNILEFMNSALAGFAGIALALALIGLFGLAAFMAAQRTKEIGIRKVLGARASQITRLLVWQFSKPVLWALVIALPLAYVAAENYLNFFADRIAPPLGIMLLSGGIAVLMAWITVAGHAFRISRANPILALRYE